MSPDVRPPPRGEDRVVVPTLIVLGGLPGTGKTTLARELARAIGAVYLRIDSIEQAIRESARADSPIDDAGYRVAYSVANDNLRIGHSVIADSVNPLRLTRDAWVAVGRVAKANVVEIEVVCSDTAEHKRRVETRISDIDGAKLPSWQQVVSRHYEPWDRERLVIDTAGRTVAECVSMLRSSVSVSGQ